MSAIEAFWAERGGDVTVLPLLRLRLHRLGLPPRRGRHHGVRLQPVRPHAPDVLAAGYHNANERVHVDDLLLSVEFHLDLARACSAEACAVTGVPRRLAGTSTPADEVRRCAATIVEPCRTDASPRTRGSRLRVCDPDPSRPPTASPSRRSTATGPS